jgi:RNA polymerase sigma-70 factor (ECF subfamily)
VKDESLLVAQLKNTDTQELAFRNLMKLYKERLYWHIRKIVLSHDDADDPAGRHYFCGPDRKFVF